MADKPLAEDIADTLRRAILRGTIAPGDPVKERDHAKELNISRTPMREAIRILAKEGLIILRPSRSPIVANPDIEEIAEDIEVIQALEILSGELACLRATDAEISEVRSLHEAIYKMPFNSERILRFEADMDLHAKIVEFAHNDALLNSHRAYLERLWRIRFLSATRKNTKERVHKEHGAIVEALEKRDTGAIKAAIANHLESMLQNVRELYESGEHIVKDDPAD